MVDQNLEPWEIEIASLREQLAQAEQERDAFANTIRLLTEENLTVLIPRMEAAEAQVRELEAALVEIRAIYSATWASERSALQFAVDTAHAALEARKKAAGG